MEEPTPVSEVEFTPWGDGWSAWNEWAPEVEFADFVGALVRLIRPAVVVESGVGNGFITRRVLDCLPAGSLLHAVESDEELRARIPAAESLAVVEGTTIPDLLLRAAQLVIVDSEATSRVDEMDRFANLAPKGAVLVVHDVANKGAGPAQQMFKTKVDKLRLAGLIDGAFLPHPRGSFVGSRL